MRKVILLGLSMLSGLNAGSLLDFSYGKLEDLRGNGNKAKEFYSKAHSADPTAMPLVRIMSRLMLDDENRAGALKVYQDAIAARPNDDSILVEYGDFLGDVGRGDAIADRLRKDAYSKFLESRPGTFVAVERMIRFLREKGDGNSARELLESLGNESPDAVRYYVSTTKSLYDSRDEEAGIRIDRRFESALKEHPEWEGIARKASDHFRETGRMDRAIEVLDQHLEVRPSSLDLKIRQAILMFSSKLYDQGVAILKEVLEIHPKKALAHESLAKYYRREGLKEEARTHAAELLKIRGGSPEDFLELAGEMVEDGDIRSARLLLEKAAFDHEDDANLMMKLAIVTAKDPETKNRAARLFEEAERLLAGDSDEMDPAFMIASAKELVAQGQVKAAEDRLRTAIRNFPKSAKKQSAAAMRALAEIWTSEGRNQDAAKALIKRAEAMEK
ncbi:MAG: tetratricopeptide repeat protein [Verrucomicrobia bacterium]|jgi:tetratricopeptide (TPR) repeat protein|nr:tetratricopeptide repeat protein [Verrucomicrobiota bacterium]|tara:strand:+ start:3571 stop:4905 length:1335 start_codon:yes stop_codon:yes gene_type:complete